MSLNIELQQKFCHILDYLNKWGFCCEKIKFDNFFNKWFATFSEHSTGTPMNETRHIVEERNSFDYWDGWTILAQFEVWNFQIFVAKVEIVDWSVQCARGFSKKMDEIVDGRNQAFGYRAKWIWELVSIKSFSTFWRLRTRRIRMSRKKTITFKRKVHHNCKTFD